MEKERGNGIGVTDQYQRVRYLLHYVSGFKITYLTRYFHLFERQKDRHRQCTDIFLLLVHSQKCMLQAELGEAKARCFEPRLGFPREW